MGEYDNIAAGKVEARDSTFLYELFVQNQQFKRPFFFALTLYTNITTTCLYIHCFFSHITFTGLVLILL